MVSVPARRRPQSCHVLYMQNTLTGAVWFHKIFKFGRHFEKFLYCPAGVTLCAVFYGMIIPFQRVQ